MELSTLVFVKLFWFSSPKEEVPIKITQFCPISLCNVIYKIITKVLVNHIIPNLDNIINPLQSSFILGRNTFDNILVAQELIHSITKNKSKKALIAYKINLKKSL